MKRLPTLTAIIALALTAGALVFTSPVFAQSSPADAVGLMALPPRIGDDGTLVVQPGATIQLSARVRNTSGTAVTVQSLVEDFVIGEDGKTPIPVAELTSSRWSLAQWIQIPTASNSVGVGQTVEVPFVIQVPQDALPGGRYAMIMHQIAGAAGETAGQSTGGQAAINQRVGSLVYLRVDGPITEDANIRNLSVPSVIEYGPVPITFEIENLSDVHIRPATTLTVTNWLGKEVDNFSVETMNIFPFSQREFATEWQHMWGFGKYTVKVETSYGSTGKVVMAMASFWMIPYTIILGGSLMIVALIGIYVATRRHLSHRNDVTRQHIELLEEKIKHLETELPDRR